MQPAQTHHGTRHRFGILLCSSDSFCTASAPRCTNLKCHSIASLAAASLYQQKFTLHHIHQPCILTQATSNLHPEYSEHPDTWYAIWLHPVLGPHPPKLPQHPERFKNTTPYLDATSRDLLRNLSSGRA